MGVNAALGCYFQSRRELHLAGGRKIEKAARIDHRTHRRRMRQRLQRIVQVDAGQHAGEPAVLRANALAIEDEERRAKFADQPPYVGRLEWINEAFHYRFK